MAGYRKETFSIVRGFASRIPLNLLLKITGQTLILPVYHVVSDEEIPHIKHLYTVKKLPLFENDLDFLLDNFDPIDFQSLIEHLNDIKPLTKPSFFLSFDDGLSEFHSIIAPILLARGVPAMNFLNPAFVDNRDLFFRYKVSLLIDRILKDSSIIVRKKIALTLRCPGNDNESLRISLLNLKYSDLEIINQIAALLKIDFDEYLVQHKPYLTRQEIKELINKGFTFGAHSIDHPLYSELSTAEQIRQTETSVQIIQKTFDLKYRSFAFPFTDFKVSKEFFDHFYKAENKLDASFGSAGLKKDIYSRHLQRIPMEMGQMTAREILHSEYLYYLLKYFVGKNRIWRS